MQVIYRVMYQRTEESGFVLYDKYTDIERAQDAVKQLRCKGDAYIVRLDSRQGAVIMPPVQARTARDERGRPVKTVMQIIGFLLIAAFFIIVMIMAMTGPL